MASFTVDQKLLFERYDGVPGIGCRRLRKNIILHGGPSDENGFNYADTLLREDEVALVRGTGVIVGGVVVAAVVAPGAPAMPRHCTPLNGHVRGTDCRASHWEKQNTPLGKENTPLGKAKHPSGKLRVGWPHPSGKDEWGRHYPNLGA